MKIIKELFKRLIPPLVLVLLPILLFNKIVLGNVMLVTGDFSGSDLLDLNLPFKETLHTTIPKGNLPIWEPNLSLGFPILAEGQIGVFYPPNAILSFLPSHLALMGSIILAYILAGLFTYGYAKSLKFNRFSAFITAITFAFSAFFITRVKHVNMITVSAWLPFLFWATKKLFQRKNPLYALAIGIGIALQVLAGHPEMTFFILFVFLIYAVYEFLFAVKISGLSPTLPLAAISLLIIITTSLGLSAVQILPSLEFTGLSERTEFTEQTATAYPYNPKNLVTLISPYYFGNPASGSYSQDIRIMGIFWENASYAGLLPIILAFWVIVTTVKRKSRNSALLFFIGLAAVSLLLMMGRNTPLFGTLWNLVPGFQLFRFPNRFNLFLIFSIAVLAGSGANDLIKRLKSIRVKPQGKTTESFRFSWPLKTLPTELLIAGLIVLDQFVFASSYFGYLPLDKLNNQPEIAARLRKDDGIFRMYSLTQYGQSPYALGWKNNENTIVPIREALPPNTNLIYNLASFSDRSWFEGGLGTKRRNRLENFLLRENQNAALIGKLLGMFNVKYIISFADWMGIEIQPIEEYGLGDQYATTLKLFENLQVMSRVFYVPSAEVIKGEEKVFTKLKDLEFNPTTSVILEEDPRELPPAFFGALDEFQARNPVVIKSMSDTEVVIESAITSHGFLVLSDLYYPGWKATVDGKEVKIFRANYLVRALELDPGTHIIRFFYDPLSFKLGATVSAATLVIILITVLLAGLLFLIRKKRR